MTNIGKKWPNVHAEDNRPHTNAALFGAATKRIIAVNRLLYDTYVRTYTYTERSRGTMKI